MTVASPEPDVTAIVPALNAAAYLPSALESLQAQSLARWEAVVVNDGSTDETGEIADRWAEKDPRIRVLHQENRGLAAARNAGLRLSRGRLIHCLDADDLVAPEYYEQIVAVLDRERSRSSAVGLCAVSRVQHLWSDERHATVEREGRVDPAPGADEFRFERMAERNVRPPVCHVFERRILEHTEDFDESLDHCQDWDLWLRFARVGVRFIPAPEALAYYRLRSESLSSSYVTYLRDGFRVMGRALASDARCRTDGIPPVADPQRVERGMAGFWEQNLLRAVNRGDAEGVDAVFVWGRENLPADFWERPDRYDVRLRFDWSYDAPPPSLRSCAMMWNRGELFLSALERNWPELTPDRRRRAARALLSRLVDAARTTAAEGPRFPRPKGVATLTRSLGRATPRPLLVWLAIMLPAGLRRGLVGGIRWLAGARS